MVSSNFVNKELDLLAFENIFYTERNNACITWTIKTSVLITFGYLQSKFC